MGSVEGESPRRRSCCWRKFRRVLTERQPASESSSNIANFRGRLRYRVPSKSTSQASWVSVTRLACHDLRGWENLLTQRRVGLDNPPHMELLKDKVAVVTGAGRGIGRATALALARSGARVVVNDCSCDVEGEPDAEACGAQVVEEIRAFGGEAHLDENSVASPQGAEALIRSSVERLGGVNVLINNAGIGADASLHRLDSKQWQKAIDTQLSGSFYCLREAAAWMKRNGGGSIVNTTSVAGLRGGWGQSHGSSASAGVVGLTRTASVELQKYEIRVNAVAPIAKTRLTEHLPLFAQVDTMLPEHVAPAHVYFASDSSAGVTGVILSVAGGKLSVFRLVETLGTLKEEEGGIWTAEEIADNWSTLSRQ